MKFKPILLLSAIVTCLHSHSVYADSRPELFLSAEAVSQGNIAPSGTAYSWSGMTSSTANTKRVAQPGLNNNNLTSNVDLQPNGDKVGAWEAAGVI